MHSNRAYAWGGGVCVGILATYGRNRTRSRALSNDASQHPYVQFKLNSPMPFCVSDVCMIPKVSSPRKWAKFWTKILEFTHFLAQLADHPVRVVEINSERRGSRYRSAGLTRLRITRPTPRRNEKKRSISTLLSRILQDTQFVTRECRAGNSKHALLCETVVKALRIGVKPPIPQE